MATLTLKKSVDTGQVASAKGAVVSVERRRKIVMPGQHIMREEPKSPTQKSAADEKLRAVLEAAKEREAERRKVQEEDERQRSLRDAEIAREAEEYQGVKEQLRAREAAVGEEEKKSTASHQQESPATTRPSFGAPRKTFGEGEDEEAKRGKNKAAKGPKQDFSKGRISIRDIVMSSDEDGDRDIGIRGGGARRSEASLKRFRDKARAIFKPTEKVERVVAIGDSIIVKDLAAALAEKVGVVVKKLMEMGMMASQNQSLDADTAELIATEFGATVRRVNTSP